MNANDEPLDEELLRRLKGGYNPPPEVPRDEMWAAIRAGLAEDGVETAPEEQVVRLDAHRGARQTSAPGRVSGARWGLWVTAAAAAAVLLLGVGLGRMTAPVPQGPVAATGGSEAPEVAERTNPGPMRQAAARHLQGTETFLSLVKSDARTGELSPEVQRLAGGLLTQTRLFLDAAPEGDPELRRLMEDLELVLAQVVSVEAGSPGTASELNLALDGMDRREVLPRIRTWSGGLAGT